MIHSNCMLLALGLLIFCFQDACSVGNYPAKCYYEPKLGWCYSPVVRYFFNHVRAQCMMFTYSGCMGNANNFLTFEECVRECQSYGQH
ncbi:PI-actitoxin-Afv2a-like [Thamnophis elegans]|uniref:PI-actitoxin-Afv2a-like n=1 Tax=Thamnophis elegans TaxID=35005 RepID=UPI001378AC9F|nr:PI-actitoxin-Afv2a-like [Thamnophis elegans]